MAAKPRVHEIASELGVDSKVALEKLKELGEYVKRPSSTIEPPVARSFRATGGSMVDEGLLTYSPSSFSFSRAILLSTPSSEAISCTRGLPATILLSESTQTGQTVSRGRVSFRAVHFVSIAVQPFVRCRCCSMVCVSSGPDTRNARTKARRRMAVSTHSLVSWTHAPLPGIDARSSGTRTESMATTRRRADRGARVRHPTHVRTASILHAGRYAPDPLLLLVPPEPPVTVSPLRGSNRAGYRSSRR